MIKLGLIGDNILSSRAPKLHQLCGKMCNIDLTYELLIPLNMGMNFEAVFENCARSGYRGVNITLPYKIRVMPLLQFLDKTVQRIGAVNTVIFGESLPYGFNTDYSGFIAAYRARFGSMMPGVCSVVGAGGVGRAVTFALLELGASKIRLYDCDKGMSTALANDAGNQVSVTSSIDEALDDCDGVLNCTPFGMEGYGGTAIPPKLLTGKKWAFDAVYTPLETEFLQSAKKSGLSVLDGYELHFYQGILAFQHFTGHLPQDLKDLRRQHLA